MLVTLMLSNSKVTSQHNDKATYMYMQVLANKRYDVAPRDVITRCTEVDCAAKCRDASWCVSANVFTGDGTCQLLSEDTSDETSLESADGWRYLRKCKKKRLIAITHHIIKRNIIFFCNICNYVAGYNDTTGQAAIRMNRQAVLKGSETKPYLRERILGGACFNEGGVRRQS